MTYRIQRTSRALYSGSTSGIYPLRGSFLIKTILNSTTKDEGHQLTKTTALSSRLKFIGVAKTEPKSMNVNVIETVSSIDIVIVNWRINVQRRKEVEGLPGDSFDQPLIYPRLKPLPLA